MAYETMQDDETIKAILADQQRLESERAPWENIFRQVDRYIDPSNESGFGAKSPGTIRGEDLLDVTGTVGLDRYEAAIAGITIPRNQRYLSVIDADPELMKLTEVQRWYETATDRLFAARYAPPAGFEVAAHEDIRQEAKYGTAPFWIGERPGKGLFYRALHLSEIYIDTDWTGRVDTVHRKFELTLRQAEQTYGRAALPPKLVEKLEANKGDEKIELLHVIRPNRQYQAGKWGAEGKTIESIELCIVDKWIVRRGGYYSMPIVVSRATTAPGEKYGRGPAMKVLPTIKGLQEMARTLLKAGHKAVDPALAFFDDGNISKLSTKPGGLNPGLVDEFGRLLVQPMPGGGQLPLGMEMIERERGVVQVAFLEEVFKLLTDPSDRMTATQVLETAQKQGLLVAPYAGRRETEKDGPTVEREMEILQRARQLPPMPGVMMEAGARPRPMMNNPLSRMARSEEAAGFARWSEMLVQIAPFDQEIVDLVDTDKAARGVAEVLGVRPSWVRSPDEVAARRKARAEANQETQLLEQAPNAAGAVLDLAKAGQIANAA